MAMESMRERDRRIAKTMAGRARADDAAATPTSGKGALEAAIRKTFADRSRLGAEDVFGRGKQKPKPKPEEDTDDDAA